MGDIEFRPRKTTETLFAYAELITNQTNNEPNSLRLLDRFRPRIHSDSRQVMARFALGFIATFDYMLGSIRSLKPFVTRAIEPQFSLQSERSSPHGDGSRPRLRPGGLQGVLEADSFRVGSWSGRRRDCSRESSRVLVTKEISSF